MAIDKDRRQLGVSTKLYDRIKECAAEYDLPMTRFLEVLVERHGEFDINWKDERDQRRIERPSWQTMVKRVEEYQKKLGADVTDETLCSYTGYTLATVETITHTAHKRALRFVKRKKDIDPATLAEKASVSVRFAERFLGMYRGEKRIPERERYLFATG